MKFELVEELPAEPLFELVEEINHFEVAVELSADPLFEVIIEEVKFSSTIVAAFVPGHAPWTEDEFVATNGQTVFTLSGAPTDSNSFTLHVNGVQYDDASDFTVAGSTLTWTNNLFALGAGDRVTARFY